jgi:uncharacterized protein (TIGR03118 family)
MAIRSFVILLLRNCPQAIRLSPPREFAGGRLMKMIVKSPYSKVLVAGILLAVAGAQQVLADGTADNFKQTNLVSDLPGVAKTTDPDLVNPWGVSFSSTSPFWVSANGSGLATLYNGAGDKLGLVVTVPPAGSTPTGQVFNATPNFNGDLFIFASENGTITGWRGALGTTAETLSSSTMDGVYKGLAIGTTPSGTYLYATDFHNNQITVLPGTGAPALTGNFTDPTLPAGYAPFNIQNIGGKLYVTYAVQDAAGHDDVAGPGNGIVDVFDLQGNFLKRLISNGGPLNSPWGMAIAPAGFGNFGNDLLVGNFGDGTINAFDPTTGDFLGQVDGSNGKPLINMGLWDLTFGNGGNGGSPDDLYFTAGIPGPGEVEDHGLFGSIAVVPTPEPGTLTLIGSGLLGLIGYRRRRSSSIA